MLAVPSVGVQLLSVNTMKLPNSTQYSQWFGAQNPYDVTGEFMRRLLEPVFRNTYPYLISKQ